jgi:hypothetical protein
MDRRTLTLEVETPEQEALILNFHSYVMEIDELALSAPEGEVLDQCETAAVAKGQDINRQTLQQAIQRRIDTAEKKVRR